METNTPQSTIPMSGNSIPNSNSMPPGMLSPVPIVAKIISILFYLSAIAFIFLGTIAAFLNSLSLSALEYFGVNYGLLPGILSIAWGVVSFFAGRGLWNGQQWGRILAITSSVLYIIFGVITMFTLGNFNYFSLVINLVIILYLLLSKDVRTAFASAKPIGTTIILAALAIIIFAFMEYPNLTPKETKMEKALRQMHEASKLLKKYQK